MGDAAPVEELLGACMEPCSANSCSAAVRGSIARFSTIVGDSRTASTEGAAMETVGEADNDGAGDTAPAQAAIEAGLVMMDRAGTIGLMLDGVAEATAALTA